MEIIKGIIERTGVDDIIALVLVLVSSVIWLQGNDIPETLSVVTVMVVGFYFGKKYTERGVQAGINAVSPPPAPPYIPSDND
jgi:hypothetical protein